MREWSHAVYEKTLLVERSIVIKNTSCTMRILFQSHAPLIDRTPIRCEIVGHENEAPSSPPRAAQETQGLGSDLRGQSIGLISHKRYPGSRFLH